MKRILTIILLSACCICDYVGFSMGTSSFVPPEKDINNFMNSFDYELVTSTNYLDYIDTLEYYSRTNNKVLRGNILCQIGAIYYRHFDFSRGLGYALQALQIGESIDNHQVIVRALRLFADNYYSLAMYDKSIEYFNKELEYHKKSGNTQKIAEVYCNIGVNHEVRGNVKKGLEYYFKALDLYEQVEDKEGLMSTHSNMGFVYRSLGNDKEAIKQFRKAAEIERDYLSKPKEYYFLVNIAESLKNLGDIQDALKKLNEAEIMLEAIENPDDEDYLIWIDCARITGEIYTGMKNYNQAKLKYIEALEISRKARYIEKEGKVISSLSGLLLEQGEYSIALRYLERGLKIATETKNYYLQRDMYQILSSISAKLGNYHQAWEYQKLHGIASDSVLNLESSRQINILQIEYETEKKENQIHLLTTEKELQELKLRKSEIQKIYIAFMAILFLALAGVILNRYRIKKLGALVLAKKNEELSILNATKDKFFTIIAHDLKNPVSAFHNISKQVDQHFDNLSTDELRYYVNEFSSASSNILNLLKNLLEWAKSQRGQHLVFTHKLDANSIISKTIEEIKSLAKPKNIVIKNAASITQPVYADENILNTVLRNVLINAIKFSPQNSEININSETKVRQVIISISDAGIGISREDLTKLFRIDINTSTIGKSGNKGTGLGLILCKELLEQVDGNIWVESILGEGSTFFISLPVEQTKKIAV